MNLLVGGTQLGWKSANLVRENKNGVLASLVHDVCTAYSYIMQRSIKYIMRHLSRQ